MPVNLTHPLPAGKATDGFGWRKAIPGVVAAQLHTGQDYAAPTGTPVLSAHEGRVNAVWYDKFSDGSPAGGNMLKIDGPECSTRYAHLNSYAVGLGDQVRAGQVIGYVGRSGAATGPHLHFEVLIEGRYVNPAQVLKDPPKTQEEPKRDKENEMAQNAGFTTEINGVRHDAIVNSDSGFFHPWSYGDGGTATAVGRAFGVPYDFAKITESQWRRLEADCAAVRERR